jgi:hypothetical protein
MEYNDENLLKLKADGLSQTQIATMMHVSKGKVAGRLRRLRLLAENPNKTELKSFTIAKKEEKVVKRKSTPALRPKAPLRKRSVEIKPRTTMSKEQMYEMLRQAVENTK